MKIPTLATGGDLLAETLRAAGVDRIFTLHGGHLECFFKACVDQEIDMIDFRHEAAAGYAADAYARATAKLGVCVVTADSGVANVMSAIANAYLDASPTLFIIGAPPLREAETNPLQGGFDQIAMVAPVTKWAHRITQTERAVPHPDRAGRRAVRDRRGQRLGTGRAWEPIAARCARRAQPDVCRRGAGFRVVRRRAGPRRSQRTPDYFSVLR